MSETSKEVVIKLRDTQISELLAAIRLGITLEQWCSDSIFIETGAADSMTPHWQGVVVGAKMEIIKQSGIDEEHFAHARGDTVGLLRDVLYKEFKKWHKTFLLREAKEDARR